MADLGLIVPTGKCENYSVTYSTCEDFTARSLTPWSPPRSKSRQHLLLPASSTPPESLHHPALSPPCDGDPSEHASCSGYEPSVLTLTTNPSLNVEPAYARIAPYLPTLTRDPQNPRAAKYIQEREVVLPYQWHPLSTNKERNTNCS